MSIVTWRLTEEAGRSSTSDLVALNVGYSNVINRQELPGDTEFVVGMSDLKPYLESLGIEVSLLIEMTKDREHTYALYQDFRIITISGNFQLRVEYYDDESTSGNSLTIDQDIVTPCGSISV